MRDPYSVLGVKRDAKAEEIKSAWRTIAKAVHPDHNKNDPAAASKFAEVGQAYDVLKDPKKRGRYDDLQRMAATKKHEQTIMQQRKAAREAAERAKEAKENAARLMEELARADAARAKEAAASGAAQAQAPGSGPESPEDVISRIFDTREAAVAEQTRAKTAEAGKAKGEPADAATDATAKESGGSMPLNPVELIASLMRRIRGIPPPTVDRVPDLIAEGVIGIDDLIAGRAITVTLSDGREVRVAPEPGGSDGQAVRLKGQGLKVQGMQRGDAVVTLRLDPATPFRVIGTDIHTILPISLQDAVLGGQATAPSPAGPVEVTVPAWSGSDQTIRVEGGGLPKADGNRGDLVVEIRLMLWDKPDEKVTDLMRSMREGLFL